MVNNVNSKTTCRRLMKTMESPNNGLMENTNTISECKIHGVYTSPRILHSLMVFIFIII